MDNFRPIMDFPAGIDKPSSLFSKVHHKTSSTCLTSSMTAKAAWASLR